MPGHQWMRFLIFNIDQPHALVWSLGPSTEKCARVNTSGSSGLLPIEFRRISTWRSNVFSSDYVYDCITCLELYLALSTEIRTRCWVKASFDIFFGHSRFTIFDNSRQLSLSTHKIGSAVTVYYRQTSSSGHETF